MGNQKKVYDNPKDAAKDLLTVGGAAIINKTLQTPIKKAHAKPKSDLKASGTRKGYPHE